MERIEIQNFKNVIIIAVILFLLSAAILFWARTDELTGRIYGAKLDHNTSKVLLYIFSIFPFLSGVNYLIKFISVLRYDDFSITMNKQFIRFPEDVLFHGFKAVSIDKKLIEHVEIKETKHSSRINLMNKRNEIIGSISGEFLNKKTIGVNDLANKIELWIKC